MIRVAWLLLLFAALGQASFIRSPIPPSASGHFISDENLDGRADRLTISFLKTLSNDYIKKNVDSLVLEFPDENYKMQKFVVKAKDLKLDAKDSHRLNFEIPAAKVPFGFSSLKEYAREVSATLFQRHAASVELVLQDSLSPVPLKVFFSKGNRQDTLKILFSEPIRALTNSGEFSLRSSNTKEFRKIAFQVEHSLDSSVVMPLLLPKESAELFSPADSIYLETGLVEDYFGNVSKAGKVSLSGLSPFRLLTISQASFSPSEIREHPVFELDFKETGTPFPKDKLGVALDMGEESFESRVLELLQKRFPTTQSISNDKISVVLEMAVFSHTGSYLTGSQAEIKGNDERLVEGRRVFFFWNFMDGRRRYVGSGAYFVRIGLRILYQGKMLYQERSADFNSWGVLRRE